MNNNVYVFAAHSGDFGRWAYYIDGKINYGQSKGTTLDQMYLMGILQVLRNEETEEIKIYIAHNRTYKRMIGEYDVKSDIMSSYMDEISWATGTKKIEYIYIEQSKIETFPFYIGIDRMFKGRDGLYFDIIDKDISTPFEVCDPFNNDNKIEGYICRKPDERYGMLYIEFVNEEYCPQWIWATPKMHYPFDKNGSYHRYEDIDRIEMYEKLDGTNVLAYTYTDHKDKKYITYKTRLNPVIKDGKWGKFEYMWKELLEKYPMIPKFCLDNECNVSFEMYGSRNPILIKYDNRLDAALLFCRTHDGFIHPPSVYDLDKYGLKSATLWKVLDRADNFIEEYQKAVKELNAQLKIVEVPDGNDIVEGWEGVIWYAIKGDTSIQLKCKADYIKDIHWLASAGIPKHSIYITCMNAFEDIEEPKVEDIINLLREEFEEIDIQKKINTIERIYYYVYEQMILRTAAIDEYNKHPEFDIKKDKRTVMRYFSNLYDKRMMSKVYTVLWNEFGE